MATKVEGNKDGSVWTFTIRKDSRWSDNAPVHARATSSGRGSASWTRPRAAPYAVLPLRHQERRGVQQEAGHRRRGRSASRAKDDWTLEVTLEGPRGYFPVLAAYLAALPGLPAGRREARRQVDGGRPTSSATAPSRWRRGSTTSRWCSRRTRTTSAPRTCTLSRVVIPIIPVAVGRPALREQRDRPDDAPGRRPQAAAVRSADAEGRLPLSVSRDLVPASRR